MSCEAEISPFCLRRGNPCLGRASVQSKSHKHVLGHLSCRIEKLRQRDMEIARSRRLASEGKREKLNERVRRQEQLRKQVGFKLPRRNLTFNHYLFWWLTI